MNKEFYHIVYFFLIVITVSCNLKKDDPSSIDIGQDYYPLEKGSYRDFYVQSIKYTTTSVDTVVSYERLLVGESSVIEGVTFYDVSKLVKNNLADPFELDSVYLIEKNTFRVLETRNNVKHQELVFPVELGRGWDFNAYNTKDKLEASFSSVGGNLVLDSNQFSTIARIMVGTNTVNLVETDLQEAIYAKGVGLIYIKKDQLKYQPGLNDTTGIRYMKKIIEYGKM